MAHVALAPRVDAQIPQGGNRERLALALQFNRWIFLDPTEVAQRHEWEQTAWNVAAFVSEAFSILFAGTAGACAGLGLASAWTLLTPEFVLPTAFVLTTTLIVSIIVSVIFGHLREAATAKARASGWLALIERGVAAELENLPPGPNPINIEQIARVNIPQDHRFIAARYLYWKNQVANLEGMIRDGLQIADPANAAHLPQNPRERREPIEAARLDAFRIETEQVLPAKVQAAYWYGILRRPDFRMEFEEQVSFDLPPFSADNEERSRRAQARLVSIGLAHNFNVVPDAPYATITRGMWQGQEARIELTLAQVRLLTEGQLSMMVVPVA